MAFACRCVAIAPCARRLALFEAQVTFLYFRGRLDLFDEQYMRAEQQLSQALELCPRRATRQLKRILKLLIPVSLACTAVCH